MPKYRVTERSYINLTMYEEGATVDFDGVPGPNLEPLDAAAVAAKEEAAKGLGPKNISTGDMARQKVAVLGGSPEAVDAMQAATAASAAAAGTLQGSVVQVDGKPVEVPGATPAPVARPAADDASGLV